MVIPLPLNFVSGAFGMGLSVMLLLTSATVGVFVTDGTTFLAVTVSALFLLIAATASLVGSFGFVFDWVGFRMTAAIG